MKRGLTLVVCALLALTGCAPKPGQNQYGESEVGVSRSVEFGTVLNKRTVQISSKNSKVGEIGGGLAGAGAGSYIGNGSGSTWAAAGGAVVGAVAGYYGEHALYDRDGYEYVVQMQSGDVKTITQEKHDDDTVIKPGDHVMLQYCDAGDRAKKCDPSDSGYQRLIPVEKLPPYVKKKRKYIQTQETGDYTKTKAVKGPDDVEERRDSRDD